MEQLKFIGKRLVYLVVMLFGVATLVFILTKMIPGDPTVANLSQRALNDPEIVAAYRAKYGLDQPLPVQYILYMKNLLQFDLGTSMRTNKPAQQHPGPDGPGHIRYRRKHSQLLVCPAGIIFLLLQAETVSGSGPPEQRLYGAGHGYGHVCH